MFNLRHKIYVAEEGEFQFSNASRYLILHETYFQESIAHVMTAALDDPKSKGATYSEATFNSLVSNRFGGDLAACCKWITDQENMKIICDDRNYKMMFAFVLLELKHTFRLSDEQALVLLDAHKANEYISNGKDYDFRTEYELQKQLYKPCGKMFAVEDPQSISSEWVYALYKWDKVDKVIANAKIATLTGDFLRSQIANEIQHSRLALAFDQQFLREYLDVDEAAIGSFDDAINAIRSNALLSTAYNRMDLIDIDDDNDRAELIKLCHCIIENSLDMDSEPAIDKQVFDLFVEFYNDKNIDLLEANKYNFMNSGFVSSRSQKFNKIIIMSL
jgi:hypothetical protein